MIDHSREVKNLVETAYADLPRTKRQEVTLDLFCNLVSHAYLQSHLLAIIKPQSLTEAVQARNEYLQIRLITNPGVTIRQIDKKTEPEAVHVT